MRFQHLQTMNVGLTFAVLLFLCGCGGGDTNYDVAGTSTVHGKIIPAQVVTVALQGTDFSTTSSVDGVFMIMGILPGDYTVVFATGGSNYTMSIHVPEHSIIELHNVQLVGNGTISIEDIAVTSVGTGNADIGGTWDGVFYIDGTPDMWRGVVVFDVGGVVVAQAIIGELTHGTYSMSGSTVTGTRFIHWSRIY
jgi:hypothetical protein